MVIPEVPIVSSESTMPPASSFFWLAIAKYTFGTITLVFVVYNGVNLYQAALAFKDYFGEKNILLPDATLNLRKSIEAGVKTFFKFWKG